MIRAGLCIAVAALLAACTPTLPRAPAAIAAIDVPGGAQPPVDGGVAPRWWRQFHNDDLERWLAVALADNPGLAQARSRVEAAQAALGGADASRYPHADADARITRLGNSENGDRAIYNGETYTLGVIEPLNVSYHLDLWGQDRALIEAAAADAQVARAQLQQSELLLTAALIKTYFAWQTALQLTAAQQRAVDLCGAALDIQAAALAAGLAPQAELVARETQLAAARTRLAQLAQRQSSLRYALLALLGQGPDFSLPPAPDQTAPETFAVPAAIDLNTLAARPDIQIALWQARAAQHREEQARAAYYPNINLRAVVGLTSIGLGDLLRSDSRGYAAGPALNLPLFEGGALDAKLRARAAAHRGAVYFYNQTVLNAAAQVAADLANLDHSHEQFAQRAQTRAQAQRLAAIADSAYRSGVGDRQQAVQAQLRQLQAEMDYLTGRLGWLDAITDTATDLGGGIRNDECETQI